MKRLAHQGLPLTAAVLSQVWTGFSAMTGYMLWQCMQRKMGSSTPHLVCLASQYDLPMCLRLWDSCSRWITCSPCALNHQAALSGPAPLEQCPACRWQALLLRGTIGWGVCQTQCDWSSCPRLAWSEYLPELCGSLKVHTTALYAMLPQADCMQQDMGTN